MHYCCFHHVVILTVCSVWAADEVCDDVNTAACSMLLASDPNMCQDAALSASCQRFCGFCRKCCVPPHPVSLCTCACARVCVCVYQTGTALHVCFPVLLFVFIFRSHFVFFLDL